MLASCFYISVYHTRVNSLKLYKLCNCKHIETIPINREIDRRHKQIEIGAALNRPISKTLISSPAVEKLSESQDVYVQNLWRMMRGHAVADTLEEGTDPDGGFPAPDEFENQPTQKLQRINVLRIISHVIQINSGEHRISVAASEGTAAWPEEEAACTESST